MLALYAAQAFFGKSTVEEASKWIPPFNHPLMQRFMQECMDLQQKNRTLRGKAAQLAKALETQALKINKLSLENQRLKARL